MKRNASKDGKYLHVYYNSRSISLDVEKMTVYSGISLNPPLTLDAFFSMWDEASPIEGADLQQEQDFALSAKLLFLSKVLKEI